MNEVIADLPSDDRPRERLMKHGSQTLSDAELLAIILGSGVPGKNAIQLAREILVGGKLSLAGRELKKLTIVRGMGPAKAARVAATFEFARRVAANDEEDVLPPPFDREALGRSLMTRFAANQQERLGAVFLDSRQRVLKQQVIFSGTIDQALVSTRDIIRIALEERATGVVLFHNHPSGDTSPSEQDLGFTARMRDSLKLCDLRLVDHLIVSSKRYLSMAQRSMF